MHFQDMETALAMVPKRPLRSRRALARWAQNEPDLAGLTLEKVFSAPGALSDAQARALIRTARTPDPDAELAGWMLVWQFSLAIVRIARLNQKLPGSETPRGAVCTAMSELWRQVQEIDLGTNRASIFYALLAYARREVNPSVHHVDTRDLLIRSLVSPESFTNAKLPRVGQHRWRGADQRATPEDAVMSEPGTAGWATIVHRLAEHFTEEVISELGWNRDSPYYPARRQLLRRFLACRAEGARTGEHRTSREMAERLGEPWRMVRLVQADANRVLRRDPRYRAFISQVVDDAVAARPR